MGIVTQTIIKIIQADGKTSMRGYKCKIIISQNGKIIKISETTTNNFGIISVRSGFGLTIAVIIMKDGKTKQIGTFVSNSNETPTYHEIKAPKVVINKMFIYDEYNLGASKKKYRLQTRNLTVSEIAMCKTIFGNSIKYSEVKVHSDEFMLMGAMGVYGEIYFHPKSFELDYAKAKDGSRKVWFIHEMTHIWQFQKGYSVFRIGLEIQANRLTINPYKYEIEPHNIKGNQITTNFNDYNMESQADILCHYFAMFIRKSDEGLHDSDKTFEYYNDPRMPLVSSSRKNNLARIAEAFINGNKDKNWLPKSGSTYIGYLRK